MTIAKPTASGRSSPDGLAYDVVTKLNEVIDAVNAGTISGAALTATAAEVDALHSQGAVAADFAKLHALTATAAEVNTVNGVTAGQAIASKAVVTDANVVVSGLRKNVHLAQANATLTALQSDDIFVMVVDGVATLPAAAAGTKGVQYTVSCGVASSGVGVAILPNSADHIRGAGLTAVDAKKLINTGATDAIGDSATIVCDGVDGWIITGLSGTWAKEA